MTATRHEVVIDGRNDARAAFAEAQQQIAGITRTSDQAARAVGRQSAAMQANAQAARAMEAAHRAAAFRQRMLAVQGLDVAQSLALGMPPMQVAIQQGGQIAGIYAGQGGVAGAFREAASSVLGFARAHPVAIAATVALGGAALGLQNQIAETTGVTVGFGDLFMATMGELAAAVQSVAGPAISALGPLFARVGNGILDGVTMLGNSIVNTFHFAYRAILALWNNLPSALGDLAFSAAQKAADGINPILRRFGLDGIDVANPYAGAASDLGGAMGDAYSVFQNNPMGDLLGRISDRAVEMAQATQEAASGTRELARAAQGIEAPLQLMESGIQAANDNMNMAREVTGGFISDFRSAMNNGASAADAFGQAFTRMVDNVTDRLLNHLLDAIFQVQGASRGGGGLLGSISSLVGGLFGGIPGFATGTNYAPGGLAMVGERGPELVNLPRGSQVIPNHALGGAGKAQNITINQNVSVSGTIGAAEIAQAIQRGNQSVMAQIPGVSLTTVTTTNRRAPGSLG